MLLQGDLVFEVVWDVNRVALVVCPWHPQSKCTPLDLTMTDSTGNLPYVLSCQGMPLDLGLLLLQLLQMQ
eukprot:389413-Prorocentrum_lima.AAC.1